MDMNVMDDHILDELESEASTKGYAHIGSPTINGFVAGHDQLLIQPNNHAVCKYNPQGPIPGNRVPEGSRFWIHHVVVGGIGHNVHWTSFSTGDSVPEPKDALNQPLAVLGPVRATPPASVNWVGRQARSLVLSQVSSCAVRPRQNSTLQFLLINYIIFHNIINLRNVSISVVIY